MSRRLCFGLLVCATLASNATGQTVQNQRVDGLQNVGQPANMDQMIAGCLLLGNSEEIALAEYAQERADDDRVREFASKLIRDHKECIAKLRQIAPQHAQQVTQIPGLTVENVNQAQAPADQGGNSSPTGSPIWEMQKLATQECLRLTKDELGQHDGSKFDMAFMGSQVGSHIGMLAKLKASERFSSDRLRPVIQEATSKVEQHLEDARQLCQDLGRAASDNQDERQARRDANNR